MTPAEEALRDMWLAEMGAVVREYHPPVDETVAARIRNDAYAQGHAQRGDDTPEHLENGAA